jgi:hypothetical protein
MKLVINFEDGYDVSAEIKVDKDGFARIEELANSLALPPKRRPTKRALDGAKAAAKSDKCKHGFVRAWCAECSPCK